MSMAGYTKLFNSILASTIWRAGKDTKLLWITMLAMAGQDGIAHAAVPGLAHMSGLTVDETEKALEELSSPDRFSRTKDHEGRRIQEVEGGWLLLNHAKYRAKMGADERREYKAQKQREYRKRDRRHRVDKRSTSGRGGHKAETESKAETEERTNARAETVTEASMRLAAQNGYKPEPASPREGKLLDQIECRQCGKAGYLVSQAPRNGHPVQFYCRQASGGCGFSLPAKYGTDILAQMTPGARKAIEAMIPAEERPYESPGMIIASELKFDDKGMLIE